MIHHTDDASTEEAASVSQDRHWTQTNLKDLGDAVKKRSKKKGVRAVIPMGREGTKRGPEGIVGHSLRRICVH